MRICINQQIIKSRRVTVNGLEWGTWIRRLISCVQNFRFLSHQAKNTRKSNVWGKNPNKFIESAGMILISDFRIAIGYIKHLQASLEYPPPPQHYYEMSDHYHDSTSPQVWTPNAVGPSISAANLYYLPWNVLRNKNQIFWLRQYFILSYIRLSVCSCVQKINK